MRKIAILLLVLLPSCDEECLCSLPAETSFRAQSETIGILPPRATSKEVITCIVNTSKVPGGEDVCNYKCPDRSFGLCWRNPAGSWDCSECRGRAYCESWTSTSEKCPYL